MKRIPDESIDMILCDLPYGTTANAWDSVIPFNQLWGQYERLIKDNGAIVLTANQGFTNQLINSKLELYKYKWIWVKSNATNFINAKNRPMSSFEEILIFSKGKTANGSNPKMNYFPQGLVSINKTMKNVSSSFGNNAHQWNMPKTYNQEFTNYPNDVLKFKQEKNGFHPTQKPVALFEYLIKTYTIKGNTVLDNCMGSGTTAIACLNTDRKFIGFETNKEYFEKSLQRIKNNTTQLNLFE
ncbi:DNA-methyltransferase [Enterococcus faecalis]|uniref:DNA-methyltransferase n=1 Tax=Enterococcus faecalis TaxID=1351 RepID=UPI003D0C0252